MATDIKTFTDTDWSEVANADDATLFIVNTGVYRVLLAASAAAPADDWDLNGAVPLDPKDYYHYDFVSGEKCWAKALVAANSSLSVT